MEITKQLINRSKSGYFSKEANTLVYDQERLIELINSPFSVDAFQKQIEQKNRNYCSNYRQVVCDTLEAQYKKADLWSTNIERQVDVLRKPNTFTVTTGHQLSVYTGPLFFIYKILHTVKLAQTLQKQYPDQHFIPVFWLASEDHDFEEIRTLKTFHQAFSWESNQKGPVGRFNLEDFQSFKEELSIRFENDASVKEFIVKHYQSPDNLATATLKLVHDLLGEYSFLTLDADHKSLKNLFSPVIEKELLLQFSSVAVERQNIKLEALDFKQQVTPREINLFYIEKGKRDRIIAKDDNTYKIGEDTISKIDLLAKLKDSPECFSPNVVLRPVYQEYILPNLCYIGGGGEMTYWLQLKGVFDDIQLTYPLIQVRNSIQILDKTILKKLIKLGLSEMDLFRDVHQLKKEFVIEQDESELDFTKIDELGATLGAEIESLINTVDQGLSGYGKSETVKLNKQLEGIKTKLIRHQKKKFDDSMNQIDAIFDKAFPSGGLQERADNVLQYLAIYGKNDFLNTLFESIDPKESDLIVLSVNN